MSPEHFTSILKQAGASKPDKEGWESFPETTSMTAYVAHAGTPLTIPRIEAVRRDGEILYARTQKKDLFCVPQSHVVALAIEGALRQEPRRAGFG